MDLDQGQAPATENRKAKLVDAKKLRTGALSLFLFLTIVLGGIVAALLVVSSVKGLEFTTVFGYFFKATITRPSGILNTLTKVTPLMIVSLGLLVAFKTSVWNIGAEGQIVMGIVGTLAIALNVHAPGVVNVILAFVASFVAGALWAGFAGALKARWNVPEIPVTLMQNFIAAALMSFLISGPWMTSEPGYARTPFIPDSMKFPLIRDPLSTTVVIAVLLVPIVYWLMNRSVVGYKLAATGENPSAAAAAGLNPRRMMVLGMILSGGICALAGTTLILGEYYFGVQGITSSYGFYAIVCVLLAEMNVLVVPLTAFFIAFVLMGSSAITNVGVPGPFVNLTMGIVFIAALVRIVFQKAVSRK